MNPPITDESVQGVDSGSAVSNMKKIRINELARELEVKPGKILDLLPELGVAEKKTHSSSIDEDVAILIRRHFGFEDNGTRNYSDSSDESSVAVLTEPDELEREEVDEHVEAEEAEPVRLVSPPPPPAVVVTPAPPPPPVQTPAVVPPAVQFAPGPPKVDSPKVEAPKIEVQPSLPLQMAEVPKEEAPKVEPPRPEVSKPELPKASASALPRPEFRHAPPSMPVQAAPAQPAAPAIPAAPAPPAAEAKESAAAPHHPLRPPLGGGGPRLSPPLRQPGAPAPSIPIPASRPAQPSVPAAPAPPSAASAPAAHAPAVPQPPAQSPMRRPAIILPASPTPPTPRPGQILSGPRQPLPENIASPAPRPPSAAPGPPRQAPSMPAPPRPPVQRSAPPMPTPPSGPGPQSGPSAPMPGQQRPPLRPTLAGQPAARPVVPPRPDLVARLQKAPGAPAPAAPRPGMPTRPPSSPVPGQPIYRGPIRPGQPMMRGPGGPGGPMPGAPGPRGPRQRMLHPTSPMRIEPAAPLPTDTQRRHQTKPGARTDRHREIDREGKLILPSHRREQQAPIAINREITIADGITVKELSEKLGVKANLVIKKLVERKIFATINQTLDTKLAEELSREFGASTNKVSYEEEATQEVELAEDPKALVRRAPVVTIMGHVDHGKTSLLDAIRVTNVAAREAGGITQHIGAYSVTKNDRKIVFIDTPGHQAFTRMRARGAKITDIVVLVVSADDGVMPQTLEAMDHAKAAGVPIIVAINKIDKPEAQPERIKQQLADRGLLAEDWGGDVVMVPVSAKAKTNLDLLLEMILLVADMLDLKANPNRPAVGTVLEAQLDRGRGPVPTVLVRNGTLRVGDHFICGAVFGKVRAMFNDYGSQIKEAGPAMPVEVLGLESLPEVGDTFQVVTDTAKAKQIVIYRESRLRDAAMLKTKLTLEQLHDRLREGDLKELNIIIKADVGGTSEVLSDTLQKLSNEEVKVRVLHSGVGAITESDVLLASASSAIIVGFNVKVERNASAIAEREKVDIRMHSIIYDLTDEIKKAMTGMLAPVYRDAYKGKAEVREVFKISKVGTVAGCMVIDGSITRDSQTRVVRGGEVMHTGRVESLKRFKNDASEVKQGFECGITIAGFNDIQVGDVIEAFVTERVLPT